MNAHSTAHLSRRPGAGAVIPLVAGIAATLAIFSLFRSGTPGAPLQPVLALDTIPGASWRMNWSAEMRTPASLQLDGLRQLLSLLRALAYIVLAGACVNAAIALLSQATRRRYEIALRAML